MSTVWPRFLPSGDAALTVELGDGVSREVNARVVRLHRALMAARPEGIVETVPAFRSLLVTFDPLTIGPDAVQAAITALLASTDGPSPVLRRWLVPACYAPEFALDLADVAAQAGLSLADAIECHTSATYYIYMLGFLPGFAYMGDLPEPLRQSRRHDPRTRVPKGAVAVATGFTAIYPQESPGGWHIIGRSPAVLFDAAAPTPALLAAGDEVRFAPVSLDEFGALSALPGGGVRLLGEGNDA